MRQVKALTVAVLAVGVAMAAGAASAGAEPTALCSSEESGALTCAQGNEVTALHAVSIVPIRLLTTSGTVPDMTCESSLLTASVLPLGNPQVAHLTSWTWVNCRDTTLIKAPCTLENKLLGLALVLKTAPNLAAVDVPDLAVFMKCGEAIACTFKLAAGETLHASGAVSGTVNAHMAADAIQISAGRDHQASTPICPQSNFDALYEFTEPVYIKS